MLLGTVLACVASAASAGTLCPDGTFVPGDSCTLSFDGSHVIGGPVTLPPVALYVEGRSVAIVPLRRLHPRRVVRVSRNPILDAPPGTRAIEIPRLAR
jgi:hypothetical protein